MTDDIGYALVVMKHDANHLTTMHPPRVHHFGRAVLRGVIHKKIFSMLFSCFHIRTCWKMLVLSREKKLVGNGSNSYLFWFYMSSIVLYCIRVFK